MVEMSLKELFEIGQSFESSVGEGTKGERARIFKIGRASCRERV